MARKRKRRNTGPRASALLWLLLAASLAVIAYAWLHPARAPRQHAARHTVAAPPGAPEATAPAPVQSSPEAPGAATAVPATTAPSPAPSAASARLAIIIDDCGQWLDTERGFIALPVALTLSVLPDVRYNHTIEREAAAAGKGVMLHLPMETLSGLDPGPGKVTTAMDDAAIAAQVEHDLADVDLAQGVNNHEGSKGSADARVMGDVAAVLAQRGRFFIDSRTNPRSVGEATAREHGVPSAARDVFLDNTADVDFTEAQLRRAAAIAKAHGSAIAIGHPRPTTLTAVRAMIAQLQADGITFVPASELVR
ncbi:MAG: divergent polysaccharide deacetylase family protein [Candidatus Velthaea sp.]